MWPGRADHRRHGGVDDHVARHVQVGDAAVGVDHGEARPGRPARRRTRRRWRRRRARPRDRRRRRRQPSFGLTPAAARASPCVGEDVCGKKARTTWPKMIGSETFIIVALRWTEKRTPSSLARGDLLGEELLELGDAASRRRRGSRRRGPGSGARLRTVALPSASTSSIRTLPVRCHGRRALGRAEVAGAPSWATLSAGVA